MVIRFAFQPSSSQEIFSKIVGLVFSNSFQGVSCRPLHLTEAFYLHTCHKSKCKHLLSWVSHKPNNKTFQGLHLSIRCVYASVLTTNTHTYQSFILLKSSAWNVFIYCVVSSEARIIQSFASWSRLNLNYLYLFLNPYFALRFSPKSQAKARILQRLRIRSSPKLKNYKFITTPRLTPSA